MLAVELHTNEKILRVVRKHWFVFLREMIIFVVLLFIPSLVQLYFFYFPIQENIFPFSTEHLTNFVLGIYGMGVLALLLLFWLDYYLDMWIITNERIIDIDQRGIFNREVSEIPLAHVQDITIDVNGVIETFLRFGTIRIQTAGEREFTIDSIPEITDVKEFILTNSGAIGKARVQTRINTQGQ